MNTVIIVAIIGCTIAMVMIKNHQDNQTDKADAAAKAGHAYDELKDQISSLKKRIETLETIVTDKAYDLKKEIDDL